MAQDTGNGDAAVEGGASAARTAHATDFRSLFASHDEKRDARRASAAAIATLLWRYRQPASVIDVGCGMGFFLAEMQGRGAAVRGVDGPWIREHRPEIAPDLYDIHDLEAPYAPGARYDLACSMEVGEHLSRPRSPAFVAELCALSDVVLFSAAVPGQKGNGHVNNRWQGDWAEMFESEGFDCYDPFRRRLMAAPQVSVWFTSNLLLYVKRGTPIPRSLSEHQIPARAASYMLAPWHDRAVEYFRGEIRKLRRDLREARAEPPSPEALTDLPGIGPALAGRLVAAGVTGPEDIATWDVARLDWADRTLGKLPAPGGWAGVVLAARGDG
ncbi:MAG: methyltransferase domain-containing protein [Shimia sp.]